ncbi:S8 family serine peptidase [Solwaraspora sp. WMMD791]|uniref:S8 family serine peptidase n=1 Tax=Solwaraspora sp. WMMD791 TaxID=3016086 RepID=UPI00249B3B97|nr:S8 family serine peptidase [Solwaraspora sp. WMMD791]WFE28324.1 S8 family serine peptidase [Solwaraspora sp. WMMD791]
MRMRGGRVPVALGLLLAVMAAGPLGVAEPAGAANGAVAAVPVHRSAPEPGPTGSYQLYYVVAASVDGRPENLWLIASRLLGDADRATDIFDLNAGRPQPTGGALVDPSVLRAGWELVLPWDAVGDGVRYGHLTPVGAPVNPSPTPRPSAPAGGGPAPSSPRPGVSGQPGAGRPSAAASPSSTPTPTGAPSSAASRPPGTVAAGALPWLTAGCQASLIDWGQPWPALDEVWSRSQGAGVTVAVVDSGVDATLPELTGRVNAGADIVTGAGQAGTDCLGTGTAIAGIVAADLSAGSRSGVAPEAGVLPVRLVDTAAQARIPDQVTAIEVALSTGAEVVVVGGYVDLSDRQVTDALATAAEHDSVVVVPARAGADLEPAPGPPDAVLRVAAVDDQGAPVAEHPAGEVDVVAPAVTGVEPGAATVYAAAYVAGVAALLRAAQPELTAAEVVQRLTGTAELASAVERDEQLGWGSVDPAAAVSVATQARAGGTGDGGAGGASGWPLAVASVVLVILGALFWARRRLGAPADDDAAAVEAEAVAGETGDGAPARSARADAIGAGQSFGVDADQLYGTDPAGAAGVAASRDAAALTAPMTSANTQVTTVLGLSAGRPAPGTQPPPG